MRPRHRLATLLPTLALVIAPGVSGAVTVSPPVPLEACPTDLTVDAAGGIGLLTRTQARGRWSATGTVVDQAGSTTPGPSASRSWKRPDAVRSVFTGDGIAVAFETGQPKPESTRGLALAASAKPRRPKVSVVMVGPGGPTAPEVVSNPRRRADLYRISSRGGTTVVHFRQSVPGERYLQDWIAIRPAGAARFGKAVSLKSSIRGRFSYDDVYLGPDGSGVVVSLALDGNRPVSARRITADGRVGRAIAFDARDADVPDATAAIGPDGTVVLAVVDTAKPNRYGRMGLFVAKLAPGAAAFTKPELVATGRSSVGSVGDALALAIDGAGRVTATIGRDHRDGAPDVYAPGFLTFSGTVDDLVQGADIDGILSVGDRPVITPTADGSVALTWEGDELVAPGSDDTRRSQRIAFRAADGSWSTPVSVSPPFLWTPGSFALNRGSAALPGGGLAMAYSVERSGRRTTCSLVRVTP